MSDDDKTCPKCAETVKAAAEVCKHCGHNFSGAAEVQASASPVPPKQSGGKAKGCLIAIGVVVALGVLGSLAGGGSKNAGSSTSAPAEQAPVAAMKVSARDVEAAYAANEASAQQQYGGKVLEVSGTIKSIDLDFSDKPFVVLEGENMFKGPQLKLTEESQKRASSLSKEQPITAVCQDVSEVIGTPIFKDCEIK